MDCIQPITNPSAKRQRKKEYVSSFKGISFSTASIREFLMKEYEREIPIIQKIQSYRNPFLDLYFSFASYLGEEEFYILSLPMTYWFVSRTLGIELCVLLALSIGIGNMLKNTFLLPRPPPNRVYIHTNPQKDHGMPSTHTSSSLSIQFYYFIFLYHIVPVENPWLSYPVALALVTFSIISVMMSRLYNGHHTPMDVTGGFLIGSFSVFVFAYKIRPYFVEALVQPSTVFVPLAAISVACFAILIHPQPKTPTPAYPESGLVIGTCIGSFIGSWMLGNIPSLYHHLLDDGNTEHILTSFFQSYPFILKFLRVVFGVVVVLLVKTLSKKIFYLTYSNFVLPTISSINKKKTPQPTTVEAFAKLFTYTMVGGTVILLPLLNYFVYLYTPYDLENYRSETTM